MSVQRLFISASLQKNASLLLSAEQAHYLKHVIRLKPFDPVHVFNGQQGEWTATVDRLDKKEARLKVVDQLKMQEEEALTKVCLAFAPIKGGRLEFIIEKATELGVTDLLPVFTQYTQMKQVKTERLHAIAVEAAEQSQRLSVPVVHAAIALPQALQDLTTEYEVYYLDERRKSPTLASIAPTTKPAAFLIGPEGGFSPEEFTLFDHKKIKGLSLGPLILRAETAAMAVLAVWMNK